MSESMTDRVVRCRTLPGFAYLSRPRILLRFGFCVDKITHREKLCRNPIIILKHLILHCMNPKPLHCGLVVIFVNLINIIYLCIMRRKDYIGKENKRCLVCGNIFTDFISNKRKYCSRACYDKSPTRGSRPKNRIKKTCDYCGKEFERAAGNFKKNGAHHFCCHKCSATWWSEFGLHGVNHPHWTGGYSPEAYRANWEHTKKIVRERAGGKCELCGNVHGTMDVHHLIPIRTRQSIEIINHPDNLQYLCRPCHIRADLRLRLIDKAETS